MELLVTRLSKCTAAMLHSIGATLQNNGATLQNNGATLQNNGATLQNSDTSFRTTATHFVMYFVNCIDFYVKTFRLPHTLNQYFYSSIESSKRHATYMYYVCLFFKFLLLF